MAIVIAAIASWQNGNLEARAAKMPKEVRDGLEVALGEPSPERSKGLDAAYKVVDERPNQKLTAGEIKRIVKDLLAAKFSDS